MGLIVRYKRRGLCSVVRAAAAVAIVVVDTNVIVVVVEVVVAATIAITIVHSVRRSWEHVAIDCRRKIRRLLIAWMVGLRIHMVQIGTGVL